MTSGTSDGISSEKRNFESINVLKKLGVKQKNIIFLSLDIFTPDGRLPEHLTTVFSKILYTMKNIYNVDDLYLMAWEGGHQDHDAAHLIGLALAKKFKIVKRSFQFPLYTGIGLSASFFRLFKPIADNGKPIFLNIPFSDRLNHLRLILSYPSQFKTWAGLFPFFLFHYIFYGTQILQPISLARVRQRPHDGKLLYERRFSYKYESFCKFTSVFIKKYL